MMDAHINLFDYILRYFFARALFDAIGGYGVVIVLLIGLGWLMARRRRRT